MEAKLSEVFIQIFNIQYPVSKVKCIESKELVHMGDNSCDTAFVALVAH